MRVWGRLRSSKAFLGYALPHASPLRLPRELCLGSAPLLFCRPWSCEKGRSSRFDLCLPSPRDSDIRQQQAHREDHITVLGLQRLSTASPKVPLVLYASFGVYIGTHCGAESCPSHSKSDRQSTFRLSTRSYDAELSSQNHPIPRVGAGRHRTQGRSRACRRYGERREDCD